MYLSYITNDTINMFVKSQFNTNLKTILVPDCEERNYINVYTNLLDTTLHITDFECINIDGKFKEYHSSWRKFMLTQLDIIDPSKRLGDQYIADLHHHLKNCPICNDAHTR